LQAADILTPGTGWMGAALWFKENGEHEIGKTSILAAPPAELAVVSLL